MDKITFTITHEYGTYNISSKEWRCSFYVKQENISEEILKIIQEWIDSDYGREIL